MSLRSVIRVDRYFTNIPIGGMFESTRKIGRIYVRIHFDFYLRLEPRAVLGTYMVEHKRLQNLQPAEYSLIVDDKTRKKIIKVIIKAGYKPRTETCYVKE